MATMHEKLMPPAEVDELSDMSTEGIAIAQQYFGYCEDGGGGFYPDEQPSSLHISPADMAGPFAGLAHSSAGMAVPSNLAPHPADMEDPSSGLTPSPGDMTDPSSGLAISCVDMADPSSGLGPSTITDGNALATAFKNFQCIDPAAIDELLDSPIPSDLPSEQPQPQLEPQTLQQPVPSIHFNNLLPHSTQAPTTSLMQVAPMKIQQQGGLMAIENNLFPLQMIQQNNSDRPRFFPGNRSRNRLPIMDNIITPFTASSQPLRKIFSSGDLQIGGSQTVMVGCSDSNSPPLVASAEPTAAAMEESSSYKVARITQEERRAKIDRYIRKRNERNFKKKIKYACRKTLADSRPRVRGRFAKNDEFEELPRRAYNNGSYEDEASSAMVPAKKDRDVLDSSDILQHISGVNSFNLTWSPDQCGPSWAT